MGNEILREAVKSLPLFAKTFLYIRTKSGNVNTFTLNRAQEYLHGRLEAQLEQTGKVRALVLKGRQQGCCYSPDTKVLTSTYQWIPIKNIEVGQTVWSIDESPIGKTKAGRDNERRIRVSTVEAKAYLEREAYEVSLSNGVILKVTGEHRHLCQQRGGCCPQWRAIIDCRPGDQIRAFCPPPTNTELDYESGWIGGLLDGEGSFGAYPGVRMALSQVDGPVLRKYKSFLDKLNIKYYELIDIRDAGSYSKFGDKPVHCIRVDRQSDIIRLLTQTNPIRFINKPVFEGKKLPKECTGFESWVTILSIKPIGRIEVIDLQTSEKTFIAEGLVSHNSTYVQARFFHKVITQRGKKAFILTHEAGATKNLFDMAKRFYDSLPEGLAPKSDASNAKELNFKSLNSGYSVGTAGNRAVGRSQTIQLMHASEAAYYPHAEDHSRGILQAVSNENNTEILIESTANGIGNYFYNLWQSATSGQSDFQAIFIPWYWQNEYISIAREHETASLTDEEEQLIIDHGKDGLTKEHLYWRRRKLSEFSNDFETARELFSVEYPMTALDAFRNPVADRFIKVDLVRRASKNKVDSLSPLCIGVDVAISDHDRTAIVRRKGRLVYNIETHFNLNTMEIVGLIKRIIDKERPVKLMIDSCGIGAGCYDRLREIGYDCVEGVNVARSANDKDKFRNLRAELWHDMREWLAQETPVQIPDSDELLGDLTSLGYKFDSSGRLQIESKDDLRKRGMKSPDTADALALTFYVGEYLNAGGYAVNRLPEKAAGMFL